jgi:hypothetical protein
MCVNSKRSGGSAGLFRVEMVERGAELGGRHTVEVAEEQHPPLHRGAASSGRIRPFAARSLLPRRVGCGGKGALTRAEDGGRSCLAPSKGTSTPAHKFPKSQRFDRRLSNCTAKIDQLCAWADFPMVDISKDCARGYKCKAIKSSSLIKKKIALTRPSPTSH